MLIKPRIFGFDYEIFFAVLAVSSFGAHVTLGSPSGKQNVLGRKNLAPLKSPFISALLSPVGQ